MKILRSKPTTVRSLETGDHCKIHNEPFINCICPKTYSTPETDGWYIEVIDGKVTAYPTEELYNDLALWVERRGDDLLCTRCGRKITIGQMYTEGEASDYVEAFYEIHYNCLAE